MASKPLRHHEAIQVEFDGVGATEAFFDTLIVRSSGTQVSGTHCTGYLLARLGIRGDEIARFRSFQNANWSPRRRDNYRGSILNSHQSFVMVIFILPFTKVVSCNILLISGRGYPRAAMNAGSVARAL